MADSRLFIALAEVKRKVDKGLGRLIEVELYRRAGAVDADTGRRGFADPVTVEVKVEGVNQWHLGGSTLADARHMVTLYGTQASRGDKLRWGGEDHVVLKVMGLHRNTDGARYNVRAVVN